MPSWPSSLPALGLALCLSGCAAVRSYDSELHRTLDQASSGNLDGAIRTLESNNRLPDKDLLYYLKLGMLQRLRSRYQESQQSWAAAQARVQAKPSVSGDASNRVRGASSYLVNDKL